MSMQTDTEVAILSSRVFCRSIAGRLAGKKQTVSRTTNIRKSQQSLKVYLNKKLIGTTSGIKKCV